MIRSVWLHYVAVSISFNACLLATFFVEDNWRMFHSSCSSMLTAARNQVSRFISSQNNALQFIHLQVLNFSWLLIAGGKVIWWQSNVLTYQLEMVVAIMVAASAFASWMRHHKSPTSWAISCDPDPTFRLSVNTGLLTVNSVNVQYCTVHHGGMQTEHLKLVQANSLELPTLRWVESAAQTQQ